MVNFAGNSGYAILIPLFPPLAKQKGVSDALIGYIFCLYPVGGFLVSIILGKVMTVQSMKMVLQPIIIQDYVNWIDSHFYRNDRNGLDCLHRRSTMVHTYIKYVALGNRNSKQLNNNLGSHMLFYTKLWFSELLIPQWYKGDCPNANHVRDSLVLWSLLW